MKIGRRGTGTRRGFDSAVISILFGPNSAMTFRFEARDGYVPYKEGVLGVCVASCVIGISR